MDYPELAATAAWLADGLKPSGETPERAAIEANLAIAFALLALVDRLDALTDESDSRGGGDACLRVYDVCRFG